ncbi:MAG: DUF2236 domain-containing protein [Proteobacteria bacterium]|nr:MAG: DUF2236 domain-containing protein [Pseudomonadota bacterium]
MCGPVATDTIPGRSAAVGREDLELRLARLRAEVRDPRAGLFGPDSKLWEVNKHSIAFLGAGRAALLQLAHPWVATGVDRHSRTRDDPFGRFQRTFLHVFRMVYGDLDTALRAGRAVHRIHERITGELTEAAGPFAQGSAYRANDPDALLWVHATLWDTSVLCFESVVRPLALAERRAYYTDTRRFAALFGIPDDVLPQSWEAFDAYVRQMLESDVLTVTEPARRMAEFLFRPLVPGSGALMERYAELTAWLLPARLAEGFGLDRGGAAGRRRTDATLARLRRVWPHLPRRLRYLPPYVEARRRIAGRSGPDPVGDLLGRLFVGRARSL